MTTKICALCGLPKILTEYARSASDLFLDTYITVCFTCIEKKINFTDLKAVDKLLQWADIPFHPDDWIDTYETNGTNTFRIYSQKYGLSRYNRNVNWSEVNQLWLTRQKDGTLNQHIRIFNEEEIARLKIKWGEDYTVEEYTTLENFYISLNKTQNIITAIQEDQAKILCKLSVTIHAKLKLGEDISKELKVYNDTIKAAGFEPKNSRNYGDFESFGEAINYLVRKGYQPKFYDGKNRDEVDFTIKNQQTYLRRLVLNEPVLPDLVASRQHAYKISQQLEEDGQSDEEMDKYESAGYNLDYEGETEFNREIDQNEP